MKMEFINFKNQQPSTNNQQLITNNKDRLSLNLKSVVLQYVYLST